mgnify:CR=1 FL=1
MRQHGIYSEFRNIDNRNTAKAYVFIIGVVLFTLLSYLGVTVIVLDLNVCNWEEEYRWTLLFGVLISFFISRITVSQGWRA